MAEKLVTVATFDTSAEAEQAKAQLAAAGIKAYLVDKPRQSPFDRPACVRVSEARAQEARTILSVPRLSLEEPSTNIAAHRPSGAVLTLDEMTEPAELRNGEVEVEEREPNEREQNARRAVLAAVGSLLFPPLWIYAVYVMFKILGSQEPLRRRYLNMAIVAGVFCVMGLVFAFMFLSRGLLPPLAI